jgi:hypothetical protein
MPIFFGKSGGASGLVTSGLCCYLDAGDSASYSGSGSTWANTVASPADGSATSDWNFTGNTMPTFNGSAGAMSASEYFIMDGDRNGFQLASIPAILTNWTNNARGTAIVLYRVAPSVTTNNIIFDTTSNGANPGGILSTGTSGGGANQELEATVRGLAPTTDRGSTIDFDVVTTSTIIMTALAVNAVDLEMYTYFNNGSGASTELLALNPSDPSGGSAAGIGRGSFAGTPGSGQPMEVNSRLYQFLFYNRYLSTSELNQNFNVLRGRYGI